MCTTLRQLLPSVFGGNVHPRGLRRTSQLLTFTDNNAEKVVDFASGLGFGGKSNCLIAAPTKNAGKRARTHAW